ncbi:MAG TPA: hypothetical protein VF736_09365 [Pyrinomonadaceae bacterium]|jgi:hypothetical protein
MRVTKTLRRICVLALLASAFMLAGERGGVSAQSQDACGCLDDRTACYDGAHDSRDQCDQTAASQHDACVSNAYQGVDSCDQDCYYDYYYGGGYSDLNDCYNQCAAQVYDEVGFCDAMYNSDLSSCASEEYSATRFCDEEYNDCIIHCPI